MEQYNNVTILMCSRTSHMLYTTFMFTHLFDLSFQRSPRQAIGFYIIYFLMTIVAAGLFTGLLSASLSFDGYQQAVSIGAIVAILACLGLSASILHTKHQVKNTTALLLVLAAGILALFAGSILGMIPVAYLTTLPKK
jgi:hypothetical protein